MTLMHNKVWKWPSDLPVYLWQIVPAPDQKFLLLLGFRGDITKLPFNLGVLLWLQVSQGGASKVMQAISRIFSEILSVVKCRWQWGLREWWAKKMGGAWVHELPPGGEIPTNKNMFSEEQTSMCLSHYSFWSMQLYQPIRTNIPTDDIAGKW